MGLHHSVRLTSFHSARSGQGSCCVPGERVGFRQEHDTGSFSPTRCPLRFDLDHPFYPRCAANPVPAQLRRRRVSGPGGTIDNSPPVHWRDGGDAEPCPVGTPDRSLPTSFDEGSSVPTGRSSVVGTYPALKRRATIDGPSGAGRFPILSSASGLSPGGWPIVSGLRVRGSYPFINSQHGVAPPFPRFLAGGWALATSTTHICSRLRAVHCDSSRQPPSIPVTSAFAFLGLAVMTLSCTLHCDDIVFLQEHFCGVTDQYLPPGHRGPQGFGVP